MEPSIRLEAAVRQEDRQGQEGKRIEIRKADEAAVEDYTGSSYGVMNRALRSGVAVDEPTQYKMLSCAP